MSIFEFGFGATDIIVFNSGLLWCLIIAERASSNVQHAQMISKLFCQTRLITIVVASCTKIKTSNWGFEKNKIFHILYNIYISHMLKINRKRT